MALDFLQYDSVPALNEPVLLAAFAGWNDASQVATFAIQTLKNIWDADSFASIDPEEFFDFTETRPTISLDPTGQRGLEWPQTIFFGQSLPESERDVVLLLGVEPQLRWRTFCRGVLDVADRVGASQLVTLGGLLADVPHTVDPRLTGFATSSELLSDLTGMGVRMSSYEGPTGILGVLHDAWRTSGRPAVSLWGNVPHYISATPNPQVVLALLQRVSGLLGVSIPLSGLETRSEQFRTQVDEALESNPEARDYVQQLEQHVEGERRVEPSPHLIEELEEYLRRRRPSTDDGEEM
jgi:proteasome assembly chaperone (PAC2) family protein